MGPLRLTPPRLCGEQKLTCVCNTDDRAKITKNTCILPHLCPSLNFPWHETNIEYTMGMAEERRLAGPCGKSFCYVGCILNSYDDNIIRQTSSLKVLLKQCPVKSKFATGTASEKRTVEVHTSPDQILYWVEQQVGATYDTKTKLATYAERQLPNYESAQALLITAIEIRDRFECHPDQISANELTVRLNRSVGRYGSVTKKVGIENEEYEKFLGAYKNTVTSWNNTEYPGDRGNTLFNITFFAKDIMSQEPFVFPSKLSSDPRPKGFDIHARKILGPKYDAFEYLLFKIQEAIRDVTTRTLLVEDEVHEMVEAIKSLPQIKEINRAELFALLFAAVQYVEISKFAIKERDDENNLLMLKNASMIFKKLEKTIKKKA